MAIQHIGDGCKLPCETTVADGIILPIVAIINDGVISSRGMGMGWNPTRFFVVLLAHDLPMDQEDLSIEVDWLLWCVMSYSRGMMLLDGSYVSVLS
jgi:hypothetical protein